MAGLSFLSGIPKNEAYNVTMYIMAGLLVIAFFANLAVRPVASRYHEGSEPLAGPPRPTGAGLTGRKAMAHS